MFTAQFTTVFFGRVVAFIAVNGSEQIPLMFAKKTRNKGHDKLPT